VAYHRGDHHSTAGFNGCGDAQGCGVSYRSTTMVQTQCGRRGPAFPPSNK
jgi:hypothetical protein